MHIVWSLWKTFEAVAPNSSSMTRTFQRADNRCEVISQKRRQWFQMTGREKKRRRRVIYGSINAWGKEGPNYWKRPCWWGKDCQWYKEDECQFWHGDDDVLGNAGADVGNTTETGKREKGERNEAPWWAMECLGKIDALSEENSKLRQEVHSLRESVADLTHTVKSLLESDRDKENDVKKLVQELEENLGNAKDALGNAEK